MPASTASCTERRKPAPLGFCPLFPDTIKGRQERSVQGIETRKLGGSGPEVSAIGLGCMGMSWACGPADEGESLATIEAAFESGITLVDTGDFYAMGHNEMLLRKALEGKRDKVFVCVKFGPQRSPRGEFVGFDARPAAVKNYLAYTLERLGTDYVDL